MNMRSLRTKLLFQYMTLVIICMLVIPAGIAYQMTYQFRKFSSERLAEDKQQLVSMIEENLAAGDRTGKNLHGEMLRWPVTRFCVEDSAGHEFFTIKHESSRKPAPDQKKRDRKVESLLLKQTLPLHDANGKEIGRVTFYVVPFNISKEGMFLRVFQRNMIAGVAIMLICAAIIAIFMTNKIARPVLETAKRAKNISEGNYRAERSTNSNILEIQTLLDSVDKLGEDLAEQEDLRKRLMGDIAHELRSPVTVIKAQLEAFADGIWQPTAERLNLTLAEIDRLSLLIKEAEGLTTLSKADGGLAISITNLSQLIEKSTLSFEPMFQNKGIKEELDIENGIQLVCDPAKIRQIIENLLSNALRYTDEGGRVKVTLKKEQKNVILSVKDTGIGIAKEDLPNLFERFYRTDKSRARESGGMGIGLAVVKAIAQAHKASVSVQSEEGKGSCFTVIFSTEKGLGC